MMLISSNGEIKTKINDLSQMQINALCKLIQSNWLNVLNNLPSIKNG
jgi:hypothetical protein